MIKVVASLFVLFILSGCNEREIFTEIKDPSLIAHPPPSVKIEDLIGILKTDLRSDPNASIKMSLTIHSAKCTNAQSKSFGADFDGYIRITLSEGNRTIARAQMDYKGEATHEEVAQVYDRLIEALQWKNGLKKELGVL